jgi:hypothetical protein
MGVQELSAVYLLAAVVGFIGGIIQAWRRDQRR